MAKGAQNFVEIEPGREPVGKPSRRATDNAGFDELEQFASVQLIQRQMRVRGGEQRRRLIPGWGVRDADDWLPLT
jgi:hypothetical protein